MSLMYDIKKYEPCDNHTLLSMFQTGKARCAHPECRKRLTLSDFSCKCNERYCAKHRMPEDHDCRSLGAIKQTYQKTLVESLCDARFEKLKERL